MAELPITKTHQWKRDPYLITTDPTLLDHTAINEAFSSPALGWAMPLPPADLALMLSQSLNLAVYDTTVPNPTDPSKPRQIGLARMVTDSTTIAYLTDVYIHPEYQGKGLGHWLIECTREWTKLMPYLRRVALVASEGVGEEYYGRVLGTHRVEEEGIAHRIVTTKGPGLQGWDGHRE